MDRLYVKLNYKIIMSLLLCTILLFYNLYLNPNQELINYSIDTNPNHVPYISTYYINPIVSTNDDVIINYYVTDYNHTEYLTENYSEEFTITIKIEGKKTITKKHVKAGDNSINLGKFKNIGEQKFSIIATDSLGRNSHELFNYFLIQNNQALNQYIMTKSDLKKYNIKNTDNYETKYIITLDIENPTNEIIKSELIKHSQDIVPKPNSYVCIIADTLDNEKYSNWWNETIVKYDELYNKEYVLNESINTKIGLQKLLDDKKKEGYTSLKLLPGTYRIDHLSPIYIPNNFTLDLNGSTIKLNQFSGNQSLMIDLNNTFDSHVINGTIEGDYYCHDYNNINTDPEWVTGISISGESKYCSYENLVIKDITGYGGVNGISQSRDQNLGYTYLPPTSIGDIFKLGDIDKSTGLLIESNNRTTSDYIDIKGYNDIGYLSISRYLGYQGNPCETWNLTCHFYDKNKNYIKSIDGFQYRRIAVPSDAEYIKITILNDDYPTDLSIQYFRVPIHCSFKNIKFQNCRDVGLAQSAMNNMLVENCEFIKCGQVQAKCAYDAEDGWDMMQDVTLKNLNFYNNPNSDLLICAGHNFIIENLLDGKVSPWKRCHSYVIRNSSIKYADINYKDKLISGFRRFYNNNISDGITISGAEDTGCLIKSCNIYGSADGNLLTSYLRCNIGPTTMPTNESFEYRLENATYIECTISNLNSQHHSIGKYFNCTLNNIKGRFNINDNIYSPLFYNCYISNLFDILLVDSNKTITFLSCTLIDSSFFKNYWDKGTGITFNDCNININKLLIKLPTYSLSQPISLIDNSINSKSTDSLILFYDDRFINDCSNDSCNYNIIIENNNIIMLNSNYIISGIKENNLNIIKLYFKNNTINNGTILYNAKISSYPNILITEE